VGGLESRSSLYEMGSRTVACVLELLLLPDVNPLTLRYGRPSKSSRGQYEAIGSVKGFSWPEDETDKDFQRELKVFLKARGDDKTLVLICPCGRRLKLRRPTDSCRRIVLERVRGSHHTCGRKDRSWEPHRAPLSGNEGRTGGAFIDEIPIRLVLKSNEEGRQIFEDSEHMRALTKVREPISSKTLGGLLAHMADVSGLTEWAPGRPYCNSPHEILARMNGECWKRPILARRFRTKTVFASATSNFQRLIRDAREMTGGTAGNLTGKALLIGSQHELFPDEIMLEITSEAPDTILGLLAVAPDVRKQLRVEEKAAADESKKAFNRWQMLQYPKTHRETSSLLFMALVVQVSEPGIVPFFQIDEMAWHLADNRGMLYESVYEFEAGAQLFKAGIRHWKPAAEFFEVNDTERRPDLFGWDPNGRRFVIEVDVGDHNRARKRRRDADFQEGKIVWISWNPKLEPDLVGVLREEKLHW